MILSPLAFGFANAAVLGWLAAAAAPILIHLWMKRAHRETPWAAVRFLQAAIKRHSRRLRLQEWLLLAIRTAVILCVVLAASKPLLDSLGGLVGAGVRTHRVLVIDASLSMRLEDETGTTRLAEAKRLAGDLIDQSGPGDQFSICLMADPPTAPIGPPTVDRSAVRRALEVIEPTDGVTDLAATLALVEGLVESSEQGGGVDRREVVFFSDMTAAAWGPLTQEGGDAATAEAGQATAAFAKLADRCLVSAVDVGANDAVNRSVTALRVASGVATTRRPVRLVGQVRRFAAAAGTPADETAVELLVDGVAVASRPVSLAGAAPVSVEFTHRFSRPGWRRVALRLAGDRLATDDSRGLAIEVKPSVAVLCVEGRRDAARYVADALNPSGGAGEPIQVQTISDAELATVKFDKFDAVFLCNVAELTDREADRLTEYVRAGGGVTFFLGDRVRRERYNSVLGASVQRVRGLDVRPAMLLAGEQADEQQSANQGNESLLPATLGPAVSEASYGVDPLGYRHPIAAPFRGRERAGLLTTPVDRYFRLDPKTDSAEAQVVLATASGDPLMIASRVGAGRVVVVATAGSLASVDPATGRPWTAMPAWPSFVPIVRETLRYCSGARVERRPPLVDEVIGGRLRSLEASGSVPIERPDEQREAIEIEEGGLAWSYARTDLAGFYALPDVAGEPLALEAVNPDPRESDTTRAVASRLPPDLSVRRVIASGAASTPGLVKPTGIHRMLLLAALGLVLTETWLAYRFGKGAS